MKAGDEPESETAQREESSGCKKEGLTTARHLSSSQIFASANGGNADAL